MAANWTELPGDLLRLICQCLRLMEDFTAFGSVCKSWRAMATKENFKGIALRQQIPSLMLAAGEDDDYRQFYSFLEDEVMAKIFLPSTKGKKCMEAGFGWLFTIGQDGEASLVNPFTRDQINLPHQNTTEDFENQETQYPYIFYQKAVLSCSPCENPSDFVLMVIDGGLKFLSFWRPGDKLWTRIISAYDFTPLFDVVHHEGQFYAINCSGMVVVCDIGRKVCRMVAKLSPNFPFAEMFYIVGSGSSLLVVARNGVQVRSIEKRPDGYKIYDPDFDSFLTYGTNQFRVLELDLIHNKWTKIQDLGDRALRRS